MPTDDSVRRALHRAADSLTPDTAQNLTAVHRKSAAWEARIQRLQVLAVVAAVIVVAALAWAALALTRGPGGNEPVEPPTSSGTRSAAAAPNPFVIARTLTARELGLSHVLRLAFAPNGNFYVTDRSQRVAEVTRTGRVLRTWGRPGTGPGEFRLDSGAIAVGTDGRVYVSDAGNARVQVFTADGQFIRQIGTFGLDPGGHELDAFGTTRSGSHENGAAPDAGDFPRGACDATEDADGRVYVTSCQEADNPVHNTEVFDQRYRLVGEWPDGPFASSPRFGPDGTAAVVSHDGSILELIVAFE